MQGWLPRPHEAENRDQERHVIVDCIGAVAASALQNNNVELVA
jgi:hypothetical protein